MLNKNLLLEYRKKSKRNLKLESKILKLLLKIIKKYEKKECNEEIAMNLVKVFDLLNENLNVISNSYSDLLFIPKEYITKELSKPFVVYKFRCRKNKKYYKLLFDFENNIKKGFIVNISKKDWNFTEKEILSDLFYMDLFRLKR